MLFKKGKQCDILIFVNCLILFMFIQVTRSQAPPTDSDSKSSRIQDLIVKGVWNFLSAPSRWLYNNYSAEAGVGDISEAVTVTTATPSILRSIFSTWYTGEYDTSTSVPYASVSKNVEKMPNKVIKKGVRKNWAKNSNKSVEEQLLANESRRKALSVKIKQLQKDVKGSEGASERNRLRSIELQEEAQTLFSERKRLKSLEHNTGEQRTQEDLTPSSMPIDNEQTSSNPGPSYYPTSTRKPSHRGRLISLLGTL